MEKALEKITKELSEMEAIVNVQGGACLFAQQEREEFLGYITEQLQTREGLAERVNLESKTLKGALSYAASEVPPKVRELKTAMISNQVVFGWILDYYFVEEKPKPAPAPKKEKKLSEKEQKKLEEEAKKKEAEQKEADYRKKNGIADKQLSMFDLFGVDDDEEDEQETVSEPAPVESIIRPVISAPVPDAGLNRAALEKELTVEPSLETEDEPDLGIDEQFELDKEDQAMLPFDIM